MGKMSPEESSRRARIARSPKGPFSVHLEANPRMGDGSQAKHASCQDIRTTSSSMGSATASGPGLCGMPGNLLRHCQDQEACQ